VWQAACFFVRSKNRLYFPFAFDICWRHGARPVSTKYIFLEGRYISSQRKGRDGACPVSEGKDTRRNKKDQ
jgi:hypothetical protein